MGSIFRKAVLIMAVTVQMVAFQNCSNVNQLQFADEVSMNSLGHFVESFKVSGERSQKPIDMVWIIDNSGSMSEEAQKVRSNFSSYIQSVSARTDLKLAVLSNTGSFGVTLPSGLDPQRFFQVSANIESNDALTCFLGAISISTTSRCLNATSFKDALKNKNFFRAESHKVIVVVTDDESYIDSPTFFNALSAEPTISFVGSTPQNLTLFGWAGLRSGSGVASVGNRYMQIARATGGQIFDITATDWTGSFSTLATETVELSFQPMQLSRNAMQLYSVKMNGVELPPSRYSLAGSLLQINNMTASDFGATIEVEYD